MLNMSEGQIIQSAIERLREISGLRLQPVAWGQMSKHKKIVMDNRLRLKTKSRIIEFAVETKTELRKELLPGLFDRLEKGKADNWLVVSQYIPKPVKDILRSREVNYLEASGNCYIKEPDLFIFINDQSVSKPRMRELGKIWRPAGLKFLFVLLQHPHLVNEPYRVQSRITRVGLGNIGPFLEELKAEGYIKKDSHGQLFIENMEQLNQKWLGLYATVLRPKIRIGNFRFLDPAMTKNWKDIPNTFFSWGGEPAGALMTGYLKPEKFTIYTSFSKLVLMTELRLAPDDDGDVEVLEIFWDEEALNGAMARNRLDVVPPLLAYADLIASLDSRNRETAKRIKEIYFEH